MAIDRRDFLKRSTLAAAGAWTLPRFAIGKPGASANSKLNVACVGIGHMGDEAVIEGGLENLVALRDVDWRTDEAIWGDRMPAKNVARNPQAKPFKELFRSIKGDGPEPSSDFDYAAQLTEVILLGSIAIRAGHRIEWDVENMRISNAPELNEWIKEPVRRGWSFGEDLWRF